MGFFSYGKRVKNQRFEYVPRFYDPEKEKLQERLDMNTDASSPELSKLRIQDGFRRRSRGSKELKQKMTLQANIRLFLVIFALCAIVYLILQSDAILQIIESLETVPTEQ